MDEAVPRSAYLFEFSVEPGGATLGHVHAFATRDELERAARYYREHPATEEYLPIAFAAIWIVEDGKLVGHVDVPDLEVPELPPLTGTLATPNDLLLVDVSTLPLPERTYLREAVFGMLELAYGWNDLAFDEPPPPDF
jgi:hypothetical protein